MEELKKIVESQNEMILLLADKVLELNEVCNGLVKEIEKYKESNDIKLDALFHGCGKNKKHISQIRLQSIILTNKIYNKHD